MWSDDDVDYIDLEAAEKLKSLAVRFGAHELTDGFMLQNVEVIGDVITVSGLDILACLVNPPSIQELWNNRSLLSHHSVSGVKNTLCSAAELRDGDCDVFETITGHTVLSSLVEVDPSLFEGLDD